GGGGERGWFPRQGGGAFGVQGGQVARHSRCLSSGHYTCCGVVSSVRPRQQRPLSAPAERAILIAPPRFAAPAHVQSKSLGPARGWRCWSASGAKIRLTGW